MSLILQVTLYNSWKVAKSILNVEEIITFISLSGSCTFYYYFFFFFNFRRCCRRESISFSSCFQFYRNLLRKINFRAENQKVKDDRIGETQEWMGKRKLKICRNDTKRDCVLKCLMFMAQWRAAGDSKYKM